MIPAQVQIPDQLFESFFTSTNLTDEARMFRGLCESVGIGPDQLGNPAARHRMVGFLMQSLQVDLAGNELQHAGNGAYDLHTPPSESNENPARQKLQERIQSRVDQVQAAGAQAPRPAQPAQRAPAGVPAAPSQPQTALDQLARSPDADVRANALAMLRYQQAAQAGRLPNARDVPFSLSRVLQDFTYSLKEGVLNVMRGGRFKDGYARAMADSSNPFTKEIGVTQLDSRLEGAIKRQAQQAGQPAHPTATPAASHRAAAQVAAGVQSTQGLPDRHYSSYLQGPGGAAALGSAAPRRQTPSAAP